MNKNKFKKVKETKSQMYKKNYLVRDYKITYLTTRHTSASKISVAKNPLFFSYFASTFKLLHTRLSEYNNNSKFYISDYFALKKKLFHQRKEGGGKSIFKQSKRRYNL